MVYIKRLPGVRRYYRETFVNLPDDSLLLILQYLHIEDLYRMRLVCRRFNDLIKDSQYLFVHASFATVWPSRSPDNSAVFKKASKAGNLEAMIKMGMSYLYNEGVSLNCSKKISQTLNEKNAVKAASYFCAAEKITSQAGAFIWSFIRPPWASGAMCCKRHVFNYIEIYCNEFEDADHSILFSLGKVLTLQEEDDGEMDCNTRAKFWLEKAAQRGSSLAKFELWKQNKSNNTDPAIKLQRLRELRECLQGSKEAELELAMNYVTGNIGNLDHEMAAEAIKQFLASSLPCRQHGVFRFQTDLNRTMRFILVDWLVEVSTMKDFSSHILHAAISYVDQYLLQRKSHRAELQLLGIGCMLIASRFYGEDIVTIRESSWLTDNTYTYEQVVRMIGEIMACLKGETQVLTVPNYLKLFCELTKAERKVEDLAFYIADMSLLRESCGRFSCAVVALACTLLGKLICYPESTWCQQIEIFLPVDKQVVFACMNFLFEKCVLEDCLMDQQNVKLKAVKERYDSTRRSEVSKIKIPCKDEMKELIMRFSRADETYEPADDPAFNTTLCSIASSGYDGDEEDFEDVGDPEDDDDDDDDDDEMMWFDEGQDTKSNDRTGGVARRDEMEQLDSDQIERSTPSFLSPGWLQDVVNQSSSHGARTRSLGSNERREGLSRVQYHSVGARVTPSSVHSRRPLMDVNNRQQTNSSGSAGTWKTRPQFKPIHNNATPEAMENIDMNY